MSTNFLFLAKNRILLLFRAVYADADIYLLDDPLSAVDAEVGRHLFDKCIVEFLSNKTRVLVTHQLQFLKELEHIVLMEEGAVQMEGSFSQLTNSGIDFTKLMLTEEERTEMGGDASASQVSLTQRTPSHGESMRHRTMSAASSTSVISVRRSSLTLGEGTLSGRY